MYKRLLTRHWVLWVMLVLMTWSLMLDCLAANNIPELLPLRESYPRDVEEVYALFVGRDFTGYDIGHRGHMAFYKLEYLTDAGWTEIEGRLNVRHEAYLSAADIRYKGAVIAFDMTRFGDSFEPGQYRILDQILPVDTEKINIREYPWTSFGFSIE